MHCPDAEQISTGEQSPGPLHGLPMSPAVPPVAIPAVPPELVPPDAPDPVTAPLPATSSGSEPPFQGWYRNA